LEKREGGVGGMKVYDYGKNTEEVNFWVNSRHKIEDLYKSERFFFEKIAKEVKTTLDYGCAAGSSYFILKEINPSSSYIGVDISPALIEKAKKRFVDYQNVDFIHLEKENIPLDKNAVEFSFSFGVMHHVKDWKKTARELLRVSEKYVLFDVRLWTNESVINSEKSVQKICLGGDWDGVNVAPYNIFSFNDFIEFATELKKEGVSVCCYGYPGGVTKDAITFADEVCMVAVLLEKSSNEPKINILIEPK
jgi:SAM-dependent methyltransferase